MILYKKKIEDITNKKSGRNGPETRAGGIKYIKIEGLIFLRLVYKKFILQLC